MKVGTDAVLLGAWVNVNHARSILDVGTGCGVIALMMAQRSIARVDAVEPDERSSKQAEENFKSSPFSDRLRIHQTSIQEFDHVPYDLIVSNPPYFSKSLLPPAEGRQVARHTEALSFDALLMSVKRLLSPDGRFAVILPVVEGDDFRVRARNAGLYCTKLMAFYTRRAKPQERWLMEFSLRETTEALKPETLTLYESTDRQTDAYKALTGDFYL